MLGDREHVLAAHVATEALEGYVESVRQAISDFYGALAAGAGHDLAIEIEVLPPSTATAQLASRGDSGDTVDLPSLAEAIAALRGPVVSGPIRFQVYFAVWGGVPGSG